MAVLATSASGRLQLLQQIVDAGVTSILTEKILFQSVEEYRVACALVETAKVDVRAHVPYRYVDQIKALKRLHEGEPIHLNVRVGDRGLGCNGVHFIDLFQYLAGSEIISLNTTIDFPLQKNRRDASLVEFSGAVSAKTRSNAILNLEFQKGDDDLSEITVQSGSHKTVIRFDDGSVESTFDELAGSKMEMPMASAMSHFLLQDILARQSLLPSLAEGKSYNILMLESYNRALGRMPDDHCPIT
ncbi:MAG: hypothetical protein JKY20_06155 [Alphaproteobacteria bacterium]|nr:hypothetical protein [Alphaproteobacteria bacterium]